MKTFAFHSYKGGTGRTLALANFALALKSKGNEVLMIDLDFDAPGLPQKFYRFDPDLKVSSGYVRYLMETQAIDRANGTDRMRRLEFIREALLAPAEGLRIFPAGNPAQLGYWQQVESEEFRKLFSFARAGTSGETPGTTDNENWRAFRRDLDDICEAAGNPDYCLVDCKAAPEALPVPLLAWADHIVEFLHCNYEGVLGVIMLQKMLRTHKLRSGNPSLTPVISRVPFDTTPERIRNDILAIANSFHKADFPTDRMQLLPEQRDIEIGDSLVLHEDEGRKLPLAFSYADLFAALEGNIISDADVVQHRIALKLNQQDEILERFFRMRISRGELLNKDNERNVALRTATVVGLIDSLAEFQQDSLAQKNVPREQIDKEIANAFQRAGHSVGQSFGREAASVPEVWDNGKLPASTLDRLTQWCKFDRTVGFGDWTADYDSSTRRGYVQFENHFLKDARADLGLAFLRGYILGVLEYLIDDITTTTRIEITKETATKIEFVHGDGAVTE